MPRVSLRDDCRPGCGCARHGMSFSAPVGLDDDCIPCSTPPDDGVPTLPVFELRERIRVGFSDNGNAVMQWQTVLAAGALVTKKREEFDAEAGATRVTGTVTLPNSTALADVKETAVLFEGDLLWRITKSQVFADRLVFDVERNDGG